jgi:hypothetical protein
VFIVIGGRGIVVGMIYRVTVEVAVVILPIVTVLVVLHATSKEVG